MDPSPGINAVASGSQQQQQQQHGREPSLSGSTGRHGHKRSMSTKFTFPASSSLASATSSASPAAIGPPPAGRKARPVSMGYYAPASAGGGGGGSRGVFSFLSPNLSGLGGPPAPPATGSSSSSAAGAKRHSHRRSLSVSTKHGSLSLLFPPELAAKLAAGSPGGPLPPPEAGVASPPASAADERRRALEALSGGGGGGRRTSQPPPPPASSTSSTAGWPSSETASRPLSGLGVSGWDTGLMPSASNHSGNQRLATDHLATVGSRVVLPDFGSLAEDESFTDDYGQSPRSPRS